MTVATSELEALVRREHSNPHSVLGAHPADGGVVIRVLRPGGERGDSGDRRPASGRAQADPPRRDFRGHGRGCRAAAAVPPRDRLRRRRQVHDRRSVRVPADDRRARPAPDRRGPSRGAVRTARSARPRAPRRDRHRVRGVGAVGASGQRRRRIQLVGRPAARDALARVDRDLGAVPPRRRRRRALQVRDPRPRRPAAAEGRPVRARDRGAAEDGVGRVRAAPQLERG